MASGKKNYFRHSNSAFDDEKIQKCIQLLGYEGYAYYFILLEVLAKQCENSFKNPITIHQQTLRNLWRKKAESTKKVVRKLEESGLFVATFRESFVDFYIPNLAKYMGKYQTKFPPNSPNKRKEKEKKIKEKEIKEKDLSLAGINSPDDFIQKWNTEFVAKGYPGCPLTLGGEYQNKFFQINKRLREIGKTWNDYMHRVDSSEFLTKHKKGGKPHIGWFLSESNLDDVMAGKYDKNATSSQIDAYLDALNLD